MTVELQVVGLRVVGTAFALPRLLGGAVPSVQGGEVTRGVPDLAPLPLLRPPDSCWA